MLLVNPCLISIVPVPIVHNMLEMDHPRFVEASPWHCHQRVVGGRVVGVAYTIILANRSLGSTRCGAEEITDHVPGGPRIL